MKASSQNKINLSYFFVLSFWMWTMIYIQSYLLHLLPSSLRAIDLATISMLCIFIENGLWLSFILAILSGSLLDSISTIRPGFFMVYFLISILVIQTSSRFFSYENLFNKFIIFTALFLLKFLFIYVLIDDKIISILNFIRNNYLQFIFSIMLFFIITKMIHTFKLVFEQHRHTGSSYHIFKSGR